MTLRLISRSLAGTSRNDVAVGTSRLASMLDTMRAPTPRMGSPGSSTGPAVDGVDGAVVGTVGAGGAVPTGAVVEGGVAGVATGAGRPGGR